jgi:uncharacterized protein
VYDRAVIDAILDEALICHVGFVHDGHPFVIPTIHMRDGDRLYLHGSPASRMLRQLGRGIPVCITVTLLDGIVLARSVFHHSVNYRSVVILGTAEAVTDPAEKLRALTAIVNHVMPGRSADARPPNDKELASTSVLAVSLDEVSGKIRTGPPVDASDDLDLPVWAGVLPLRLTATEPVADEGVPAGMGLPEYLARPESRPGSHVD